MTTPTSRKTIADTAARYHELKNACYLIVDTGEKLSAWEYEREVKQLRDELLAHVEEFGSFHVEGVGEFRIQERINTSYDVLGIKRFRPDLYETLLELDCLKVDTTKAKAHAERLTGLKQVAIEGRTTALVVEKR